MEPHRRPAGRRVLLPAEAELCNTLGLSEDEYWYFVDSTAAYNGQRSDEYALVPDVRNETTAIVLFVVGLALQAVSYSLAPKPAVQQQKSPQLRTADVRGRSKFAPQDSFNSLQALAVLGSTIPLVFTRRGVRVSGQLLWSQLLSEGLGQQLKAQVLFSLGEVGQPPAFEGFAIGDMLLENYTKSKLALYFRKNGGRLTEIDRLAGNLPSTNDDAFSVYWDGEGGYRPYFSGVRNPTTQAQFGIFQPMPNGMMWRPAYELVLKPDSAENELKKDIDTKQDKVFRATFPLRCYVRNADANKVEYVIDDYVDPGDGFEPWGTEDFSAAQASIKEDADSALQVGELYMVGDGLAVCTAINKTRPWEEGVTKIYKFTWEEGQANIDIRTPTDRLAPYDSLTITRCAVATISNNRPCNVTEIGLKSTVWKQINGFSNVNSRPSDFTISKYEKQNGSLTLGSLNKYITRLSFFVLQVRELGTGAEWQTISGGTAFCIKGQTPQAQYNFIRVSHPFGQYEYRLLPKAGNAQYRFSNKRDVWLLTPGDLLSYQEGPFSVTFAGKRLQLNESTMNNTEWHKGKLPFDPLGAVRELSFTSNGDVLLDIWDYQQTRYEIDSDADLKLVAYNRTKNTNTFYWGTALGSAPAGQAFIKGDFRYRRGASVDSVIFGDTNLKGYQIIRDTRRVNTVVFSGEVSASGGGGSGLICNVTVYQNGASDWSITNGGQGYSDGDTVFIPQANVNVEVTTNISRFINNSLNPNDVISDFTLYEAETASHIGGPEHEIVYVNEQIQQAAAQYPDLAIAGIRLNSSKEWSNFSDLSAYFTRGVVVERLTTSGRSATNLLPEIAYALLTDPRIGAGTLIGSDQVNRSRMAIAAKFCDANEFFWDGVLDEKQNLRQWIYEQAGYCMLDFTILGGQFSLIPSVPYNSDFTINFAGKPEINALFTDGNIRNLQVSFLSPEERQLFRATVLWREEKLNGFSETRVFSVRLSDAQGGSDVDPEESFDMSGFCTSQRHAEYFAKYALKVRKLVDHGLKFETTPQAAMNLVPGDYFRLVSEVTHVSRFQNGIVTGDGTVQMVDRAEPLSGPIFYWEPGTVGVNTTNLVVTDGRTLQSELFGAVFAVKNTTTTSRVYKVESLTYTEEGFVEVAASYTPLTDSGSLAILDWNPSDWVVEVG